MQNHAVYQSLILKGISIYTGIPALYAQRAYIKLTLVSLWKRTLNIPFLAHISTSYENVLPLQYYVTYISTRKEKSFTEDITASLRKIYVIKIVNIKILFALSL